MINPELLKQLIQLQREYFLKKDIVIHRDILDREDFEKIINLDVAIIITGIRRAGKSFLMKLIWDKIKIFKNIPDSNFLYINFENEKLLNFDVSDFDLLLENNYILNQPSKDYPIYLFLDEIQLIPNWERFINRILEEKKYKVFITGSNATLLSKEISTHLTGRNLQLTLFPLSFKEYYLYKSNTISINQDDFYLTEKRTDIKKIFQEYINKGGFPEILIKDYPNLIEEYYKNILYRDIIVRYGVKNEQNLKEVFSFIASNIGVPIGYENIKNMIKMKSLMTVKNYITYIMNSFLLYGVSKHSFSLKDQIYNPDKFYLIDQSIYNEVAIVPSPNRGRILENIVFIELLRRNKEVYYHKESFECDFIIKDKTKITEAIQVTKFIDDNNRDREINGLLEAMNKYDLTKGLILSEDNEQEEIIIEKKKILIKPIYRWLLESVSL